MTNQGTTVEDKARLLSTALIALALASAPISLINYLIGAISFSLFMAVIFALALVALLLNLRQRSQLSGLLLLVMITAAAFYTIIDGPGFNDPSLIIFPAVILLASFLFESRYALVTGSLLVLLLGAVFLASYLGAINIDPAPTLDQFLVIAILLLVSSSLIRTVASMWDRSIERVMVNQRSMELAARAANLGFWQTDEESGRITRAAGPWINPLGDESYIPETIEEWLDLIHPEDRNRVRDARRVHLEGLTDQWNVQYRIRAQDGSWRWVVDQGRLLPGERDQPLRMAGVYIDVTENRHREQILAATKQQVLSISQELHDSVAQTIYSITLHLEAARGSLGKENGSTAATLDRIEVLVKDALAQLRTIIKGSRPSELADYGLVSALRNHFLELEEQGALHINFQAHAVRAEMLAPEAELALYRVAQESLNNVVRHAGVDTANVALEINDDGAELMVKDAGVGFRLEEGFEKQERFGLKTMKERVEQVGGHLEITSEPGKGTSVRASVPTRNQGEP